MLTGSTIPSSERGENKWEQISWVQALDEVAAKLLSLRDEYGPETLAAITGTHHYSDNTWPKSRFLNLFGSPNNLGNEQICHGPMTKAYELTMGVGGATLYGGRSCEMPCAQLKST